MKVRLPDWLVSNRTPEPLAAMQYVPAKKTILIYGLVDPRTNDVRYIGKTTQHPMARVRAHLQDRGACHRVHWLQQLVSLGLVPEFVLLEAIDGGWPWQEAERYWIARGHKLGWPLTNNTSGGDGVPDLPAETRERMRKVWLGRKHSNATLAKLRIARRRRVTTDATKEKMRSAMTGRTITWIDKIADANRKLTPEHANEITLRRLAGEKVADLAREYGVHRTTISKIKIGTYFQVGQRNA